MLRWFPSFQVATTCLSCSPPDINSLVTYLVFVYMWNNHCHRVITKLQLIIIIIIIKVLLLLLLNGAQKLVFITKFRPIERICHSLHFLTPPVCSKCQRIFCHHISWYDKEGLETISLGEFREYSLNVQLIFSVIFRDAFIRILIYLWCCLTNLCH